MALASSASRRRDDQIFCSGRSTMRCFAPPPRRRIGRERAPPPRHASSSLKMGKTAKGKRAWRKNIQLGEADYVDKKREDARTGGAVDELPDDALFFTDTDGGGGIANAAVLTRKEKARNKTLRVDSILTKTRTSCPYPVPVPRGAKGPPTASRATKGAETTSDRSLREASSFSKAVAKAGGATREKINGAALYKPNRRFTLDDVLADDPDAPKKQKTYDIWDGGLARDAARDATREKHKATTKAGAKHAEAASYSKHRLGDAPGSSSARGNKKKAYAPKNGVGAVEVDAAGSSYNPPEDARQEVIAYEVGKELRKKLKKQLDPVRAPVSNNEANQKLAEELYYAQENLYEDASDDEAGGGAGGGGASKNKNPATSRDGKMTKAQRNKQLRRREQEAEEEANRLAKRHRRDLSNLKHLDARLDAEAAEEETKRERRKVAREERKAAQPDRLGKHRFVEEHTPVMLKDELTGSLRTLAGTHTLLRDRLKSLQRRELVEPRRKVERVKSKSYMKYEPGAKGERETEMHESALKATEASRKRGKRASLMDAPM